ncbi:CLUMA_CG010882, isoform A [Clunio marinus]|uniref:glutathione transferase n=1 Tax=Clunio marinus TaxID=568069 RepID=A0A1J1IB30_9DIPT|nr:CLUMA_CG010882, isoform A [Clunio marinus]
MAPLILYHFAPSAPSRAALLVVRNLELDAEIKEVNLFAKEQLAQEFVNINPQHCVPTIDDNGFYLWESRAIASYLVDSKASGSSLYPTNPTERALVNQRLYFDAGTLYPRVRAIAFPALFLGETKISDEKRKQVYEAFGFMEKFLTGRKWFCGDKMTIADLSILASLSSIVHIGASLNDYPNLKTWYNQCAIDVKGYEENDAGAKYFAQKVTSNLHDKF